MHRTTARSALCTLALAAGVASLFTGCASSGRDDGGRHSRIQGDVTPELMTLDKRHIESDDRMYLTMDANARMLNDDIQRALLLDRPSRLTNFPSPYPY